MKPVALLDFSKHALCLPQRRHDWRGEIRALDRHLFRGPSFEGGMRAHDRKIARAEEENKKRRAENRIETKQFKETLSFIERSFAPLLELSGVNPFAVWCEAHLRVAESFCAPDILWAGQDGEAMLLLFMSLREEESLLPNDRAGISFYS